MPRLDMSRYMVASPKDASDTSAWMRAVDNAAAQQEHQSLRVLNLELQCKYGPRVWSAMNAQVK